MWPDHSIRRRLTCWLLLGISALLIIAGLILDLMAKQHLQQTYDQTLLAKARALITLVEQDDEGIEFEFADEFMPEFEAAKDASYFQLWLADGTPLERSRSLGADDLERFLLQSCPLQSGEQRIVDAELPDGRQGRRVEIVFPVQIDEEHRGALEQQTAILVLAEEREGLDAMIMTVHLTLALTAISIIVLSALVIRLVVGAGLRPLIHIRDQVAALDADHLAARLALPDRAEELDGLVSQFNALLDRLQAAFAREKQFASDAAHELRTPLAELRNLAEVGRRWPDDRSLVEGFFQDTLDATTQMERVVVNLLALARQEENKGAIQLAPFDLAALTREVWQSLQTKASARNIIFHYRGPGVVNLDRGWDQWFLILMNVLNNAVTHSPVGGEIACSIALDEGRLVFALTNRADDLAREDLPLMFDRFWRKDQARTDGCHTGLGLSLVKAYADQLGLAVQARLSDDQLFRLSLSTDMPITQKSS